MFKKHWDLFALGAWYIAIITVVVFTIQGSKIAEIPISVQKLLCFDVSTKVLRQSDTKILCSSNEEPLGTLPIRHDVERPTALNRTFEVRFLAAQAAAEKLGYNLRITSGFRSRDLQARLFADAVRRYGSEEEASKWVLPKDISNHPWGTAIDVNYPGDKIAVKWLEDNGSLFGLCRIYKNEWWHFEPVIAPGDACPPMMENALTSLENSETSATSATTNN